MIKIKNNVAPRLSSEYQEVEYIESTGTQYIDTGIKPNQFDKSIIKMAYSVSSTEQTSGYQTIYGSQNGSSPYNTKLLRYDYETSLRRWAGGAIYKSALNANEIYDIEHFYSATEASLKLNGIVVATVSNQNYTFTNYNIYLFAVNNGGSPYQHLKGKLYSCTFYDSANILIRDFVPCYRKSDNVVGLYDLVNGIFHTNQGTGVFLMGNEVNKPDVNLRPMMGNKKVIKRYIGENLVYGQEVQDILVTREILDSGTFRNVTPIYLTNQVDGTDGFTIKGRGDVSGTTSKQFESYLGWAYTIDLTHYSKVKFYAKKNAYYGSMSVGVRDNMQNGVASIISVGALYSELPTSWTEYELDVSTITGTKILFFLGGYYDRSGNTGSSTSYCNIRILK